MLAVRRNARISATRASLDAGDLRLGETAGLLRRAGHHMNGAVGKEQRRGQIIGHPLGAQLRQNRKVHDITRICKLAPDRTTGLIDTSNRIVAELCGLEELEW